MREIITKLAGSTPLQSFHREVRKDERGEYVLHNGMRAYLVRKDGQAYIDYWMDKPAREPT